MSEFKKIMVIGAGGTGSWLLQFLYRWLSSRNDHDEFTLHVCDGDKYEDGNRNRQEFPAQFAGMNKAEVQMKVANVKYPNLEVYAISSYLGERNIERIENGHVVFNCVDNHVCRRLVSDRAKALNDALVICSGNEEHDGNVQVHLRLDGNDVTPPIETRHPEILTTEDGDRSQMSCQEIEALPGGEQVIWSNIFSATLMGCCYQSIMNGLHETRHFQGVEEIYFDIRKPSTRRIVNGE